MTVRFQFGYLFFRGSLQKNYSNHNEVLLVLHPFTYYFLEQCLQIHIYKKLTNLKDGYGNISVMATIIMKYYIFLTKIITCQLAWAHCCVSLNHMVCKDDIKQAPSQLLELAYQRIISLTQGFGSSNGYRYIWHILNWEGIKIPRIRIQQMLKEIDLEGSELRRRNRLKKQVYIIQGPDYA